MQVGKRHRHWQKADRRVAEASELPVRGRPAARVTDLWPILYLLQCELGVPYHELRDYLVQKGMVSKDITSTTIGYAMRQARRAWAGEYGYTYSDRTACLELARWIVGESVQSDRDVTKQTAKTPEPKRQSAAPAKGSRASNNAVPARPYSVENQHGSSGSSLPTGPKLDELFDYSGEEGKGADDVPDDDADG